MIATPEMLEAPSSDTREDLDFYFSVENQCCWLIDVCNPGGRTAGMDPEPFYLWFNYKEPHEVKDGEPVVEYSLSLEGLKVMHGEALPSNRDVLRRFRKMIDIAMDRCHEEELLEAQATAEEAEAVAA